MARKKSIYQIAKEVKLSDKMVNWALMRYADAHGVLFIEARDALQASAPTAQQLAEFVGNERLEARKGALSKLSFCFQGSSGSAATGQAPLPESKTLAGEVPF